MADGEDLPTCSSDAATIAQNPDSPMPAPEACPICEKHLGRGPLQGRLVTRTAGFWVYHAPLDDDGRAPRGYLIIESDRHAEYLADLTADEARALGELRTRLAAVLRAESL